MKMIARSSKWNSGQGTMMTVPLIAVIITLIITVNSQDILPECQTVQDILPRIRTMFRANNRIFVMSDGIVSIHDQVDGQVLTRNVTQRRNITDLFPETSDNLVTASLLDGQQLFLAMDNNLTNHMIINYMVNGQGFTFSGSSRVLEALNGLISSQSFILQRIDSLAQHPDGRVFVVHEQLPVGGELTQYILSVYSALGQIEAERGNFSAIRPARPLTMMALDGENVLTAFGPFVVNTTYEKIRSIGASPTLQFVSIVPLLEPANRWLGCDPDFCLDSQVDAITAQRDRDFRYIFAERFSWTQPRGLNTVVDQRMAINLRFANGPSTVDGAFRHNRVVYLIKDNEFFRYGQNNRLIERGSLSRIFAGITSVQAAVGTRRTGGISQITLFHGCCLLSKFNYQNTSEAANRQGPEVPLTRFPNLPKDVDAALAEATGGINFIRIFKGNFNYVLNFLDVDTSNDSFTPVNPELSAGRLFACNPNIRDPFMARLGITDRNTFRSVLSGIRVPTALREDQLPPTVRPTPTEQQPTRRPITTEQVPLTQFTSQGPEQTLGRPFRTLLITVLSVLVGLIVVFCACICFFLWASRKRKRVKSAIKSNENQMESVQGSDEIYVQLVNEDTERSLRTLDKSPPSSKRGHVSETNISTFFGE